MAYLGTIPSIPLPGGAIVHMSRRAMVSVSISDWRCFKGGQERAAGRATT